MEKWTKIQEQELINIIEDQWDTWFPGYKSCTYTFNMRFSTNRTTSSIKQKYYRLINSE